MKLTVLPSKNGLLTIQAEDTNRKFYLHSVFDPLKEAERWVDKLDLPEDGVFFICGGGVGYHLLMLREKYPQAHIILSEPEQQLFDLGKKNYPQLLTDQKFHYLPELNKVKITELFNKVINVYALEKFHFLEFIPICRHYPDYLTQCQAVIFECFSNLAININTLVHFALVWPLNFFRNLKEVICNPGVAQLFGTFADIPAIIVSAGPSLAKNIQELKHAKGKALIIAVGTALKAMLKNEIEPDVIISVDGGLPNYRHFEGTDCEAPLVFDLGIYPQIVEEYKGPKWFSVSDAHMLSWFQGAIDIPLDELGLGPSVANIAFDLARRLGCNPIVLIGQDLAYTDGRSHASGTVYQDIKAEDYGRRLIPVEDINGNIVYTDRIFLSFLSWFEREISELPPGLKVIDATEGGAKISGTEIMTLRKVIQQYCDVERPQIAVFKEAHQKRTFTADEWSKIYNKLVEIKEGLDDLAKKGAKGKKLAFGMGKFYEEWDTLKDKDRRRLAKVLQRLDVVDKGLLKLQPVTMLLVLSFQPLLMRLYKSTFLNEQPGETEQEAGIRLAKKSLLLYQGIEEIARYIGPEVEKVLQWVESQKTG